VRRGIFGFEASLGGILPCRPVNKNLGKQKSYPKKSAIVLDHAVLIAGQGGARHQCIANGKRDLDAGYQR
jgi:hypothetical protein